MHRSLALTACWLVGCTPDEDPDPRRHDRGPATVEVTTNFVTDPEATTEPTDETEVIDPCLWLPPTPLGSTRIDSVRASEEFAFDALGHAVNIPDSAEVVVRTPFDGPGVVVAAFDAGELAGVRILLDGTLAVANESDGAVERVDLDTGARSLIVGGLNSPNSLAVGGDGRLYVATWGSVVRVDPTIAGPTVELLVDLPNFDLDGLTFSPDYHTLYFNDDSGGKIGMVSMDDDGAVLAVENLTEITGGSELDGMATDVCGNLYVTQVNGNIHRVSPEGNSQLYVEGTEGWTTAASFGSGIGGWGRDRLYVMDRSAGLVEIEVGVPGRPEPHLP